MFAIDSAGVLLDPGPPEPLLVAWSAISEVVLFDRCFRAADGTLQKTQPSVGMSFWEAIGHKHPPPTSITVETTSTRMEITVTKFHGSPKPQAGDTIKLRYDPDYPENARQEGAKGNPDDNPGLFELVLLLGLGGWILWEAPLFRRRRRQEFRASIDPQ